MTSQPSQSNSMLAEVKRWQKLIDEAPPRPHAFMSHHSVPYGKIFRQWDTKGRLLIWINRGLIANLPRATQPPVGTSWAMFHLGTPVINA